MAHVTDALSAVCDIASSAECDTVNLILQVEALFLPVSERADHGPLY